MTPPKEVSDGPVVVPHFCISSSQCLCGGEWGWGCERGEGLEEEEEEEEDGRMGRTYSTTKLAAI